MRDERSQKRDGIRMESKGEDFESVLWCPVTKSYTQGLIVSRSGLISQTISCSSERRKVRIVKLVVDSVRIDLFPIYISLGSSPSLVTDPFSTTPRLNPDTIIPTFVAFYKSSIFTVLNTTRLIIPHLIPLTSSKQKHWFPSLISEPIRWTVDGLELVL